MNLTSVEKERLNMSILYDENYFENGIQKRVSCYENYRWIPELTIPFAYRIIRYLSINQSDIILDYGCAKGYLVKAFRLCGIQAWGYDISDYALSQSPQDVSCYVSNDFHNLPDDYDYVVCKDVLEHIAYKDIGPIIRKLSSLSRNCFIIVPLAEYGKYVIPSFEKDKTHIIRENIFWWSNLFQNEGFTVIDVSYRVPGMKDNYCHYEKGNGFFILKRGKSYEL